MPRTKNPKSSYDPELWESLKFMAEVWNRAEHKYKVKPEDFNVEIKRSIKLMDNDFETVSNIVLTIFVEFFFCFHDDGKHLYEYYIRFDDYVSTKCIPIQLEDGTREIYWPMTMDSWFSPYPLSYIHIPRASELIYDSHLKTRSLLRIMFEQGLIKKEWLTDYDEYKEYYDVIPYEAIDKQLHPVETVRDPFKVIENNDIERLYNAIYTACEHLVKLYDTDPDLFE